ncbi:MAG: hypothetical protein HYS05_18315 [Acidobacteria bacterium]|nr:hypothetical protein [Acidobacteriota bacterium]
METTMVLNKCMAAFVAVAVGWIGTHRSVAQEQSAKPARLNKVISLFQQGKVAFGSFVPAGDIEAAIAARRSGWDFAIFEMEHSNFDLLGLRDSLQFLLDRKQILEQPGLGPAVVPLVRIPANADEQNLWIYKQVLDTGVYGIVTPHFGHSVEAARAVVSAARYASAKGSPYVDPPGHRGVSPGSFGYWGLKNWMEYYQAADTWPLNPNGEIALLPLIEDREGVEHIRDVLSQVKGIAGIFIGEVDMATSFGYPGENELSGAAAPTMREAVAKVVAACKEFHVPVGSLVNRQLVQDRVKRGFQFLVTGDAATIAAGRKAAGMVPATSNHAVTPKGRLNRVIEVLQRGKPVFGGFVANGELSAAMAARESNWDFVIFEMEHQGFSMRGLQKSLQYLLSRRQIKEGGTLAAKVVPFVRVGPGAGEVRRNQAYIQHVLDYGAYGLVVPHLDSVQHARDVVQAARYPHPKSAPNVDPVGHRGTAPTNAQAFWGIPDFKEYWRRAGIWPLDSDGEILLAPLVEDAAGAAAIKDILKQVNGIACVFIGPADLATSLGYPGQPDHPEVRKVIDQIAQACREAKVPFGITTSRDRIEAEVRAGYQFMVTSDPAAIELGRKAGGR